jgi:hypothetical protein
MAEREEKESEIEVLKARVHDLEKDIDKYISKRNKRIERSSVKKTGNNYVRLLVIFVIILVVVDILSVIGYYRPDFSKIIKFNNPSNPNTTNNNGQNSPAKCSDGTSEGACSKNKPLYCYNGELSKNARICGCPTGYKLDFQSCVKI